MCCLLLTSKLQILRREVQIQDQTGEERGGGAGEEGGVEAETGVGRQIREDEGVLGAGMEEAAVRGTGEGMGVETVGRGRVEKCTETRAG